MNINADILRQSIADYRASPAINQSFLKGIDSGYVLGAKKSNSLAMTMGSLLDATMTSVELIDDFFIISDKRPSQIIIDIVTAVYELNDVAESLEEVQDLIQVVLKTIEYQGNWKIDTKLAKIIKDGDDYYKLLKIKGDRELITTSEYNDVKQLAIKLRNTHPASIVFGQPTNEYQKAIFGNYKDIPIKGLCDIITWGTDKTDVVWLTDLKQTDQPLSKIKEITKQFQYHFQLSFYKYILENFYTDKEVKCQLLFVSRFNGESVILQLSDFDLEVGKSGARWVKGALYNHETQIIPETYIKGWQDCLNIYKQSQTLGIKDYNLEKYSCNSVFQYNSIYE